jgi:Ca2+-binding RTX toxin-like protein
MAEYYGTSGNDHLDAYFYYPSDANDKMWGYEGNDLLAGFDGNDKLYGGTGNDELWAEGGSDKLDGGKGVDQLYGDTAYQGVEGNDSDGADEFYFDKKDSGDIYYGKADTIHDFETQDQIYLKGNYTYNDSGTNAPKDGEFSIWEKGGDTVVTWNAYNDSGYHDVLVKGDAPTEYDISFYA